jgi:hypothetical protein
MTPAAGLPAYSGPLGSCPKCGSRGAETHYHTAGGGLGLKKIAGQAAPCQRIESLSRLLGGEHLCRLCGNCGYGWVEACVDQPADGTGHLRAVPGSGERSGD